MNLPRSVRSGSLLIICSIAWGVAQWMSRSSGGPEPIPVLPTGSRERFDPALIALNTPGALLAHVDSVAARSDASPGSLAFVRLADAVVRDRFYSGYSVLGVGQSWLLGILPPSGAGLHLRATVRPTDIMRHALAACSQQAIVLQDLLDRRGYRTRALRMDGHFAMEVWVDGRWLYLDPSLEVAYPTATGFLTTLDVWGEGEPPWDLYPVVDSATVARLGRGIRPGDENERFGARMRLLHGALIAGQAFGWLALLCLGIGIRIGSPPAPRAT